MSERERIIEYLVSRGWELELAEHVVDNERNSLLYSQARFGANALHFLRAMTAALRPVRR